MSGVYFEIDGMAFWIALATVFAFLLLYRWSRFYDSPRLLFSDLKDLSAKNKGFRGRIASLPRYLGIGAVILFLLAFIDPHLLIAKKPTESGKPAEGKPEVAEAPTEGIAIYLLLDQSGSMSEKVRAMSPRGFMTMMPKIDLLKNVTKDFIAGNPKLGLEGRPNDMIGMVSFARAAKVLAPLTLDHEAILKELSKLNVVPNDDQDGTSMGYAIYKTANLIAATRHFGEDLIGKGKPAYDIKSAVIILVTDGFQDPNRLDYGNPLRTMDPYEAAKFVKEKNIHLYIVNVDPTLNSAQYAPERHLMERTASLTGGKFFIVGNDSNLGAIYAEIDQLEKSALPEESQIEASKNIPKSKQPNLYRRVSFYPYLIALGMFCLFLSLVSGATILRRIP